MLLVPVVAGLLLTGTAVAAHAAPAAQLITNAPPAGFVPATVPGGSADGSLDLDQMAKLAAIDRPASWDEVEWDGAIRMWRGPGNQAALVIAGATRDAAAAQDAAQGALAGALEADGAERFGSSLSGVDGAVATKGTARAEFVAWSQGRYFSIAVAATNADTTHALIDDLVTRQSDFLRTRFGVSPVGNAAPDSGPDAKLIGASVVLLIGLGVVVVWLVRRNRPATGTDSPFAFAAPPAPVTPARTADAFARPAAATPRPAPAPIPFGGRNATPTTAPPPAAPVATEAPAEPAGATSWDDRFPQ